MKILAKLTLAAVLAASAAQSVQAEKLVIANPGGLGFQVPGTGIVGLTPNPYPPYPAPRPFPFPWPGPHCLSCPPFEVLKPGLDRRVVEPVGSLGTLIAR